MCLLGMVDGWPNLKDDVVLFRFMWMCSAKCS